MTRGVPLQRRVVFMIGDFTSNQISIRSGYSRHGMISLYWTKHQSFRSWYHDAFFFQVTTLWKKWNYFQLNRLFLRQNIRKYIWIGICYRICSCKINTFHSYVFCWIFLYRLQSVKSWMAGIIRSPLVYSSWNGASSYQVYATKYEMLTIDSYFGGSSPS